MLELSTTCAFKEHPTCRVITAQRPLADLTNLCPLSTPLRLQYNAQLDKHSLVIFAQRLLTSTISSVLTQRARGPIDATHMAHACANRPGQSAVTVDRRRTA